MMYETIIGVGTILFLIIFWTLLMQPTTMLIDEFKNMTPSTSWNQTLNQTAINGQYDIVYNAMYFSLFFIAFIIFVWIVKKAIEYQRRGVYGQ